MPKTADKTTPHKDHTLRAIVVTEEELLERQVNGFFGFLRERAIITIAVGFVVAVQVQGVVNQFVKSFLDPMTNLLFGSKLSTQQFTLSLNGNHSTFYWGAFVYALIDFFVVIGVIYALIKLLKLDEFEKQSGKK